MILYILPLIFLLPTSSSYSPYFKFDEGEARKLLNLAAGSYGSEQKACLNRTFNDVQKYEMYGPSKAVCDSIGTVCEHYVVVSRAHRRVYVVFRGTKNKFQLFMEGIEQFKSVPFFEMGNVNHYFFRAHNVLWPQLETILNNTDYSNYKITFTGHSLGGALASLAAARTVKLGYRSGNIVNLMTFGQPRVGDYVYAMQFDSLIPNSFRVVHRRDIVPHLPSCLKNESVPTSSPDDFKTKPCGFMRDNRRYHHGTEIWYPFGMSKTPTKIKEFIECRGYPRNEDFLCSDSLKFLYSRAFDYIWDHRHYFGIRVPEYGETGCDQTRPEGAAA